MTSAVQKAQNDCNLECCLILVYCYLLFQQDLSLPVNSGEHLPPSSLVGPTNEVCFHKLQANTHLIQVKYLAEQLNKLKTTNVDSPFPSSDLYSHVKENMTPATVPLVRGYEHACHASGYLAMSDRCHTQKSVGGHHLYTDNNDLRHF